MVADPKKFQSFETEYSLFELEVDGVSVWERIRFDVWKQIQRDNGLGQAQPSLQYSVADYLKGGVLFAKNLLHRNPLLSSETDILYFGHSRRKLEEDCLWWDIYCDPIHEACSHEYLHLETPYYLAHRRPAQTDNLRYLDAIKYAGTIQQLFGLNQPTIPPSTEERLDSIQRGLRTHFDVDIDLIGVVTSNLHERNSLIWLYRRLLDRIKPNLVVLVVSYGKETLIEACHERDIPVAELQHGLIYENHFGYSYTDYRIKECFPDYLLVWGDFWKDNVEYPIPDERVIPIGYQYLERFVEQYASITSTEQLLFISQGTIGKQLSQFAVEVDRHSDIALDIVYKLHPGEYDRWQDEYPWLKNSDIRIVEDADVPLYRLFAESSVQIGVSSTAVYEGLCFDLETYVYDVEGSEALQPLVDEGVATRVSTVDEFNSFLGSLAKSFDREYYFASTPSEEICELLHELASSPS